MPSRVQQFQSLVDRQPDNELFRFSLAQALESDGRPTDAVPHYEFCIAKKADWMMPRILLGKLLLAGDRRTEARALLDNALSLAVQQQHETPEAELRALIATLN